MRTREELIAETGVVKKDKTALISEVKEKTALPGQFNDVFLNDGRIEDFLSNTQGLLTGEDVPEEYRRLGVKEYRPPEIDVAGMRKIIDSHPQPDEYRAKLANSLYFADMYRMPFAEAFDGHDAMVGQMWGEGTNAKAAFEKIKHAKAENAKALERKFGATFWQKAQTHTDRALTRAGMRMTKSIAGLAEISTYIIPAVAITNIALDDKIRQWGRDMSLGVKNFYDDHPEYLMADVGNGFFDTTMAYLKNPWYIYEGCVEAVPMMLEAYLGHITGTKWAEAIGKYGKFLPWLGRVQGIAIPIVGETYAQSRDEGVPVEAALPQAILTGEIEGIIEEWTLMRKFRIFEGVGAAAKKGIAIAAAKALLGGGKAYVRGVAEETTQGINRNFWAMVFTDYNEGIMKGVFQEGAAGGLIELAMSGGFAATGVIAPTEYVGREEKLARVEAVRELMNKAPLTPEQRVEIDAECDKVKEQIEKDEYTPPAPQAEEVVAPPENIKEEIDRTPRFGLDESGKVVIDYETQKEVGHYETKDRAVREMTGLNSGKFTLPEEKRARLLPDTEKKTYTVRQLLNFTMKAMSKASRQAYMQAARDIVGQHIDLARYASEHLKGLDITQFQRKMLLGAVTATKTEAEKVAAIATIDVLVEKAERVEAIKQLRKTVRYINKKIGKMMQARGIRPEYLEKIKAVTDSFVFKTPTAAVKKRVASLKGYIDSLRESEMSKYERDFAEELLPKNLTEKLEKIDVTPVEQMSAEEIQGINKELQRLIHLNTTKNKIILARTARAAAEILNGALAELDNVVDRSQVPEERTLQTDFQNDSIAAKFVQWTATTLNHDVETLVDTITGGQKGFAFEAVVEMLSDGREIRDGYRNDITDRMRRAIEKNDISLQDLQRLSPGFQQLFKTQKLAGIRKLFTSIFGGIATPKYQAQLAGQAISLTKAEMMSIYMHAQARYNLKAMLKEGVASWKENIGHLSLKEIEDICTRVEADPKAIALCNAVADIYAHVSKDAINGMSLDIKGIELADEPNFWHIERFTQGGIVGAETYRLSLLESEGRIQPRTGSKNPIIIRDFFEVFFNDTQAVAEYVGMAKAYRASKMLFNYKRYRNKVRSLGYDKELKCIDTIIRNTEQHPHERAPIDNIIMYLLRGTVRAVLASPNIFLGQYTSVNGYFNEVSTKYRTTKLLKPPTAKEMERLKNNWAFYKARSEGGISSIALQDIAQSDMALRMFTGKVDYISLFTTLVHKVDIRAIGVAGKITDAEMADKSRDGKSKEYWDGQAVEPSELKKDSPEYWEAFRKRARYMTRRTQPMFEGENRSVHTGVSDPSKKMWFLFRSYIDQPLRMAYRAYTARQNNSISKKTLIADWANIWVTISSYAVLGWLVNKLLFHGDDDWKDLLYDVVTAPLKILTVIGYPVQALLKRIFDAKLGKRPAWHKPKVDTVAVSIVNKMIDATGTIADGLSYLGTEERYRSGPHKGELKSHRKLKDGTMMQIENTCALYGIPIDEVQRAYRGWTKEEKPISLRD